LIISPLNQILKNWWGFDSFRPFQEEIILSAMEGKDTLALLPTGGGKSVCFQVPALAKDGICLVISPLIALMKDQVDALKEKGIKALYIYSGMSAREIDIALDNAVYGDYKFLYVSPERLETEIFIQRAEKLNVNLIAVDEAHCISQWGYNFRPPYLKIAEIRKFYPKVPILALSATATPRVEKDICDKLLFGNTHNIFKQSFERKNIVYSVMNEENKPGRLVRLLEMVPGSAIVYCGYRRSCKELADSLGVNGISSDYYHAGLTHEERSKKQEKWIKGDIRVIVCTNAFGMGIDKSNVRLVVHHNMPQTLEAYYQETGRAGRDDDRSFAVAFVNSHDIDEIESNDDKYPTLAFLKRIYQAIGNFLSVPEESGAGQSFDFDITEFSRRYQFAPAQAYKALKEIENADYISLTESVFLPSRLMILIDHNSIYQFQVSQPGFEPLIKTILRSYGGCFEDYVSINENDLAKRLNIPGKKVIESLQHLHKLKIIDYLPLNSSPQLTFLLPRLPAGNLSFGMALLEDRRKADKEKRKSVLNYVTAKDRCRSKILLAYFGEESENDCGHCDYCLAKRENIASEEYIKNIYILIENELRSGSRAVDELIATHSNIDEKRIIETIRWMIDRKVIKMTDNQYLELNK
jgi:ATP-dependent DNA helicase RecQ